MQEQVIIIFRRKIKCRQRILILQKEEINIVSCLMKHSLLRSIKRNLMQSNKKVKEVIIEICQKEDEIIRRQYI